MATEQITKFQPNRTLYLRGFDGAGAAASLCNTTASSFNVCGVYRDMADFCVVVIYDADNIFEHYSVRYLPDFNLSGMVLTFDVAYQGLQPLDSAKYSWIDWSQLDVITSTGSTAQIVLWDHATLVSGNYTPAQGTFTITTGANGCTIYDRLTLFINNTSFDFVANGKETADDVVDFFANTCINSYNWAQFSNNSVAVIASNGGNGQLLIQYARTGYVTTNGTNLVTWVSPAVSGEPAGIKFPGIPAGSTIYISGVSYTVEAVTSPTTLTLTTNAPAQTYAPYLAEYGGVDGNGLTVYMVVRPYNETLNVNPAVLPLTGGNSDNVTWNISLDFTALGIDSVRQAWFTLAPQLPSSSSYADTEWTATYTNWSVTDPNDIATFNIAGPDSIRIGNGDSGCTYSSSGWSVQSANNYWRGFSQVTDTPGSTVTITYSCSQTHDLYLGTSLYTDRGIASISVDTLFVETIDCYLNTGSELVTRRLIKQSVAAGLHTVAITLNTAHNASSSGTNFIFDYIEAAVTTPDIQDALVTYANVSPALDFDTDATYKMSPQRILWHLDKLGFQGHMNEYLGVFWWNQRVRAGAAWNVVTVTVGGTWANNDYAELNIGGFIMRKSVLTWDTLDTIANHFVYYINCATVAVWAAITGTGEFTVYPRTPNWSEPVTTTANSTSGTMTTVFSTSVAVTLGGTWASGDIVTLTINGTTVSKTFSSTDTAETIATAFISAINRASLNVTAVSSGTGEFTVTPSSPATTITANVTTSSSKGTIVTGGTGGTPGYWQVDPTAANPLNFAIRQWHTDLFAQIQAAGRQITNSFSMELVYPPDDGTVENAWMARFYDGTAVSTDTGFAHLISSQCAFIANMTAFQQQVYLAMATLQSAAGLTPWLQFGEFLWWFFSSGSFNIYTISGSNPLVLSLSTVVNNETVLTPHGMSTGDRIVITGATGCTAANGTWIITVLSDTTFSIPATSNGAWTAGTGSVRGGSMAYYDAVTSAAAQAQLGRPLYKFTCQDDDPTINSGADSAFLASRLKAHIDAIRTSVLAQFPNAKFEILYPNDVNNPVCLVGPGVQYPQGGRLNAAVNLPPDWYTQPGSGLDSFKVEALSWSATYINMDLAHQAIVFAMTSPMSWPISNVAYLIPWFNGTCPWPREFLLAASRGLNIVNFWAYDHLSLMSWPIPLSTSQERSRFLG